MRAPPQKGNYSLNVHIMSDCYFGIDVLKTIKYEVKPHKEVKEVDITHDTKEED